MVITIHAYCGRYDIRGKARFLNHDNNYGFTAFTWARAYDMAWELSTYPIKA